MKIATYDAWLEEDRQDRERLAATRPEYVQRHIDDQKKLDQNRLEILMTFPYSVVSEGGYPEHDYAGRWCWQHIGPKEGPCDNWHSEYPACPLVLATEYVRSGEYKNPEGKIVPYRRKTYCDPGEHAHQGRWTSLWLGKTDYDYGFQIYFFADEADYGEFLAAFPTFTWDESWNKE